VWRLGLRTIHAAATRDCRLVLWVWHSRLLLGREDLLARHHVPMRRRARLAFLADVRGVPSGSPFVPWRAAAAEGVATLAPNDARSLIQARRVHPKAGTHALSIGIPYASKALSRVTTVYPSSAA